MSSSSSTNLDVVISFDTTGSMHSCLRQVRTNVKEMIARLQQEIPGIRIGLICHGDYGDEKSTYLMKKLDLTTKAEDLIDLIEKTGNTNGFDYAECYELVLKEVQSLSWRPNSIKGLIMIGDAYAHESNENPQNIDWRTECDNLKALNIPVYAVQALSTGKGPSALFWKQLAERTNGYHLFLDQFSYVRDILIAICLKQVDENRLMQYEQEMEQKSDSGVLTVSMRRVFDTMLKRPITQLKPEEKDEKSKVAVGDKRKRDDAISAPGGPSIASSLLPCAPSKYQLLSVDKDTTIKKFVNDQEGLSFKPGSGFYQYTKPELIGANKLIVLQDKKTGELYEGDAAKTIACIDDSFATKRQAPKHLDKYDIFVQSTSYTRKLIGGTKFLYQDPEFGLE